MLRNVLDSMSLSFKLMTPRVIVQFSFCSVVSAFVLCNQCSLQTGIVCRLVYEGYWVAQKIVLCTLIVL